MYLKFKFSKVEKKPGFKTLTHIQTLLDCLKIIGKYANLNVGSVSPSSYLHDNTLYPCGCKLLFWLANMHSNKHAHTQ